MSHGYKSKLWKTAKGLNIPLTKAYNQYSTDELKELILEANIGGADVEDAKPKLSVARKNEAELVGQRLNTHGPDEPIRKDPDTGFIIFQEEVRKPPPGQPRGRRRYTYNDPGTQTQVVMDASNNTSETFEVAGVRKKTGTATVTLPSHQVGIYLDPRFKHFRIVTYAGVKGFLREDVIRFFGGDKTLVPSTVRRVYVSNMLCFDIQSVINTLKDEVRNQKLLTNIEKG